MNRSGASLSRNSKLLILIVLLIGASAHAGELKPGAVVEISFPGADLPPSLFTMVTGTATAPTLTCRLPDNYDPEQRYPLLVYVP